VVAFRGLDKLRESLTVLSPVEPAAVDDNTADGSAVASDPLSRRVDDDIRTVVEGPDEVTASAKGVIDLERFG